MAVNFNTAFYHDNKVERVINPKTTGVDGKVLDKKPPIEQAARIEQYQHNQQVVKSDKDTIELLDRQHQEQQEQQNQTQQFQENQQQTSYDKPNRNTTKALNAYQSVAEDDKRQAFASLVGVDIYV